MENSFLRCFVDASGETVVLPVERIVNAGYAGVNQDNIKKHIEELAVMGVSVPKHLPTYYPVPANQLVTDKVIQVAGGKTSAEVEFVLFTSMDGKRYLGVGSDHTDREVEGASVPLSKQVCPNVVAPVVWDYEDVKDHFSVIQLKCWVKDSGVWRLYQDDTLDALLAPDQIIEMGKAVFGREEQAGNVLFSGTVSTIGEMTFGEAWRFAMIDPILNRRIEHEYAVERLSDPIE